MKNDFPRTHAEHLDPAGHDRQAPAADPPSRWNHCMCDECWTYLRAPAVPYRVRGHLEQKCCYCGEMTKSGIYVRGNPETTPCRGVHEQ